MNRKQFVILLVLVAVVGAAGLFIYQRNKGSWQTTGSTLGQKLLGDLPINDVAQINIRADTNEVHLAKKDGLWRVRQRQDYPANYGEISSLLLKLAELKAVRRDPVGPSQLERYQLLAPGSGTNTATLIEFLDQNGKRLNSLLLGKMHMRKPDRRSGMDDFGDASWPDGRYVMTGADTQNVALVADTLSQIDPKPEHWLDKDFFKVNKTRSVSVEFPNATNSWKVTRESESAEWKLADARADENLDSSKVSGLNYALSSPSFNDVLPIDTNPEQVGLDKPTVITLETFENFTYTLKVGAKTNDAYPLTVSVAASFARERTPGENEKPEDKERLDKEFKENLKKLEEKLAQEQAYTNRIYLVSSWTLDSLLKERSQILQEKKKDEPTAEAAVTNQTSSAESPAETSPLQTDESPEENQ